MTITPGQRLVQELSQPTDPYSLTFLIKLAGDTADQYEHLSTMLGGDRATWTEVKIGAKTVEVIVTDVVRQQRATAEQLRKLLTSITAMRGSIPAAPNSNDDLAGLE